MSQNYLCTGLICAALVGLAPAYCADPLSAGQKGLYEGITNNVIRAAEKMPEANYSFKPTQDVRSFGQLVGPLSEPLLKSGALVEVLAAEVPEPWPIHVYRSQRSPVPARVRLVYDELVRALR